MPTPKLFDQRMSDGSRNFAELREVASFESLRRHLSKLEGAEEAEYLTDSVTEMWLDFTYAGHRFTIHNPLGYWLFVADPACPEPILSAVASHFFLINPE